MRDRTLELQARVTDHFDDVELGIVRPQSAMERIDSRITEVRSTMDSLRSEIEQLQRKQQHILSLTVADPRDRDVLEDQIGTIRRRTGDLRKMVKEIDDDFVQFKRVCTSNAEVRIRKNQIDLLRKKVHDLLTMFIDTHADYRSRVSVRVRRQLHAVGEDVSDQDVQNIINDGAEKLYFREVNPLSISGKAAVEDVKQRHNEIVELEKSIATLQEIFVDMQNLVAMQSEMVNNIEQNVETTTQQVHTGSGQVKQALEYKKSATRKKIAVITLLVVILLLLIILAIILAVVLSGKKV